MTTLAVELSLVLPVYNEAECVRGVLAEAHRVLAETPGSFEIIAVDDGSTDGTERILKDLQKTLNRLRVIRITPHSGQSAAMGAGLQHSGGRVVVFMDADGQNDPRDIPRLLAELNDCDACCGWRANRKDSSSKTMGSRLANLFRRWILKDGIIDTGCTLKAFKAEWVRDLPMAWKGMHRFLPMLVQMKGASVRQISVNHRPRQGGKSKYTNAKRFRETLSDVFAVRWMQKRYRSYRVEIEP